MKVPLAPTIIAVGDFPDVYVADGFRATEMLLFTIAIVEPLVLKFTDVFRNTGVPPTMMTLVLRTLSVSCGNEPSRKKAALSSCDVIRSVGTSTVMLSDGKEGVGSPEVSYVEMKMQLTSAALAVRVAAFPVT